MNKKAWLFTLMASLGAGAVLAQTTNLATPAATPTTPAPAINAPAPEPAPVAAPAAPVAETNATPASDAAKDTKEKADKADKHKGKKKAAKKPAAKMVSTGLTASHVLLDPPVTATVKVDALNMRGQPSLTGEVITKLKKGETVTVYEEITLDKAHQGEPAKWARVSLPTNTPVWVSAHLVDSNTLAVIPNRLNVRGGPSENFGVVARLDKGTVVKEIRKNNGWLEIETPAKASAYVSADLLDKQAGSPAPTPVAEPVEKAAPVVAPVVAAAPEVKTVPAPEPAPTVVTVAPDTTEAKPAVDAAPVAATPAPAPVVAPEPAPAPIAAPVVEKTPEPNLPIKDEILPKRIVNREGIITKAYNIQAPSYFELHDATTGELLDYLSPLKPEVDLKPFIGKKVIVTGEEAKDARWKFTPVIKVETIVP